METLSQRQINAMQTKEKIYQTALQLFIEHGFNNVSINDITQHVGTAKGTFYTHFKSKDQIVVRHYIKIDDHYGVTYQNLQSEESNYEKILLILKEGFNYTEKIGKELLRVVLINQISGNEDVPFVMSSKRKIYRILLELVEKGQQNGEFTTTQDPNKLVVSILQHYSGAFMRWCLLEEEKSLTEIGIESMSLLIDSFR
ncbi:TetR/AcrR family transcriptional regulator [Neobacillus sp. FSL H8-0543]|uniref:TetR/AcrR family transcriptional regulator n=1 Tax=Neobacillus sp. FSL H8-0543 TaxID=2954672 RepID=UPI003158A95D